MVCLLLFYREIYSLWQPKNRFQLRIMTHSVAEVARLDHISGRAIV